MAAFFTSSVRAPVTGLILATEMTRSVNLLPQMLGACAIAMLVATMLKSEPIYDSLTARAVRNAHENAIEERAAEKAVRVLEKEAAAEEVLAQVVGLVEAPAPAIEPGQGPGEGRVEDRGPSATWAPGASSQDDPPSDGTSAHSTSTDRRSPRDPAPGAPSPEGTVTGDQGTADPAPEAPRS